MKIAILGNPDKSSSTMQTIAGAFTTAGISVTCTPGDVGDDMRFYGTFMNIDDADFVIAVPVEGTTFDYTTTGGMAYAKHEGKPVLIYYE